MLNQHKFSNGVEMKLFPVKHADSKKKRNWNESQLGCFQYDKVTSDNSYYCTVGKGVTAEWCGFRHGIQMECRLWNKSIYHKGNTIFV